MAHVKPHNRGMEATLAYLLGTNKQKRYLPKLIKEYENFKEGQEGEIPDVDFRLLDSFLSPERGKELWAKQAENMGWQATRMNLNNFLKYGVFKDKRLTKLVADRLKNPELIKKAKVFPYQLLTAYQSTSSEIPAVVRDALQEALEISTNNVPSFEVDTLVAIDTSGSMSSPITGYRTGSTTVTSCVQVAGLIGSCILRQNKNAEVLPFDTSVHNVTLNPRDSILTNAQKLARNGGGTDCSCALGHWNRKKVKADLVIYVSDNESWADRGGGLMSEWSIFKKRNPKAKLVLIDLTPNNYSQGASNKDILKVGGFSDAVFDVISNFVHGSTDAFVKEIESVRL